MSNYISEAFAQLRLLESEEFELGGDTTELKSFLDYEDDADEQIDIFDIEADTQEELKKSYTGNVILECPVCHSYIFEEKQNVTVDEDGLACHDIECPYCMSQEGYNIIGEVAPYQEDFDEEELEEAPVEEPVEEVEEEDIEEEELTESVCGDESKKGLKEDIENVTVETEDESMYMSTKEDGGIEIETSPKTEAPVEDIESSEEEMVIPISDESEEEVEAAADAMDEEDTETFDEVKDEIESEEESGEDEFADLEEFDEESFDGLGESYLRNCYKNVNSFKTSDVHMHRNKVFVEGIITFDSGNKKKTNFVFEAVKSDNGNIKFEGYNKQISRGKKVFKMNASKENNKLVCESLNYNYRSRNELNESVRVYGTVSKKK